MEKIFAVFDMKKFFSAVIIFCVMIFSTKVFAFDYRSVDVSYLKNVIGNWYDTKGNLVLTISSNYKINDCTVMSVGYTADSAGFYKVKINEGNSYKDIEFVHSGVSYHETVTLLQGNGYSLRRTKEPKYFESIGGIYLGMSKSDVLKLYGQPTSETKYKFEATLKYANDGFDVHIDGDTVNLITIYAHGNRKFDRSGLSARNSVDDFFRKYNATIYGRGGAKIGYGEVIYVYENGTVDLARTID